GLRGRDARREDGSEREHECDELALACEGRHVGATEARWTKEVSREEHFCGRQRGPPRNGIRETMPWPVCARPLGVHSCAREHFCDSFITSTRPARYSMLSLGIYRLLAV